MLVWVASYLPCHDPLRTISLFVKSILKVMELGDSPWKYSHQRASFLLTESYLRIDVDGTIQLSSMEWYGSPLTSS